MELDSTVLGAAIAGASMLLVRFSGWLGARLKERGARKRERSESLGVTLSHLLEIRSVLIARVGMRRFLEGWVRDLGGSHQELQAIAAMAAAAVPLPDVTVEFEDSRDALSADFPILAWRLRGYLVVHRPMLPHLADDLGHQLQSLTDATLAEPALEGLDEAIVEVAGRIGGSVSEEARAIVNNTGLDFLESDPGFLRMREEIKVWVASAAASAGSPLRGTNGKVAVSDAGNGGAQSSPSQVRVATTGAGGDHAVDELHSQEAEARQTE